MKLFNLFKRESNPVTLEQIRAAFFGEGPSVVSTRGIKIPNKMQHALLDGYTGEHDGYLKSFTQRYIIQDFLSAPTTPEIQRRILADGFKSLVTSLAFSPNLVDDVQYAIFEGDDQLAKEIAASKACCLPSLRAQYIASNNPKLTQAVASNPSLTKEEQLTMARHQDEHTRVILANQGFNVFDKNFQGRLDPATQWVLSNDPSKIVRRVLAHGKNLTQDVLRKLAQDSSLDVLSRLPMNRTTLTARPELPVLKVVGAFAI